jgi:cytochrome c peroxidase
MYRLKLFTIVAFALFGAAFFGYQSEATSVIGKGAEGTLSPPTGVTASDRNYATKVGILWETVRGATLYRIYRSIANDPATATEVGSSAANFFFDTSAVQEQPYFYWVRAENGSTVSDFSNSDQGRRAAGEIFPGPFSPLDPPPVPEGNPITAAKASLGKALFWDEQLSSTRTVSCGTCHRPATGGSDPRTVFGDNASRHPGADGIFGNADDVFGSPGVPRNDIEGSYLGSPFGFNDQVTNRKSPSYLNAGYSTTGLFWDGRATNEFRDPITNTVLLDQHASLESQIVGPPISDVEMGHIGRDWPQVAERVATSKPLAVAGNIPQSLKNWINGRSYPELFQEAFGSPEVTPARIAMAIATHERQLFSDHTPLDKWVPGIEPLTSQEELGLVLFVGFQCNVCHGGALLSDHQFHNIGVRPPMEDRGRGQVTGVMSDNGKFRSPTLRNVELHAPYMRNGRFQTLEEVIDFYDRGGDHNAPNIDRTLIRELGLTAEEKAAIVAFLKRPLTDTRVRDELPPFDRPQLFTESNRVPTISGTGRPGGGGVVPVAIAKEPPLAGNPSFTVAVTNGVPGVNAVLVIDAADPGVGTSIPASGSFVRATATLSGMGRGSINLSIPDSAALVGRTLYGRWYVPDAGASNGLSVSRLITFKIFDSEVRSGVSANADFDGDGKTDVSIFRPSLGQWWYLRSSDGGHNGFQFGEGSDKPVVGDYTGDGKADIAFFRPSTGFWYILRSEDLTFYAFPFGLETDIPAPGDFDGDGLTDAAVFRPSTGYWFILQSTGGVVAKQFGAAGDIPQVADYDGDGKDDVAVFRPNGATGAEWWLDRSSAGVFGTQFGQATDRPVVGDYTGDGKADVAFWRPSDGFWYVLRSEDYSFFAAPFGAPGDVPAPGDYDGDGIADFAVFRPSAATWFVLRSSEGMMYSFFGADGDVPLPGAFVP